MSSSRPLHLATKLAALRERRGWSQEQTARRLPSISRQGLAKLEGRYEGIAVADSGDIRVRTALDLMCAFYPDLQLSDFVADSKLRVVPVQDNVDPAA